MSTSPRRWTPLLVASLCINALILLGGLFFVVRKGGYPYVRGKYYEIVRGEQYGRIAYDPWTGPGYQRDTSMFHLAPVQPGDIVFLGDSHARGAWWSEAFGTPRVKNRGIDGDVTGGVLRRLTEVVEGRPAAVFVFIGSNDVDRGLGGATVEETLENAGRIVDRIREGSPSTAVYLLSAPPKSARTTLNATETPLAWRLNDGFARVAQERGATYLDVSTPMREADGSLQANLTYDGSHLNGAGYRRVLEVVRPHVERHLATVS